MSKVILAMSTSLDGIAGGANEDEFWSVLGWVFTLRSWRAEQGMAGGEDNVDSEIWGKLYGRVGAQIVGRRMFDFGHEPWGENPPFHVPVFVPTHRPGARIEKEGGTSYTFVTDGIAATVEQAKAAAGGRDVLIAGGIQIAQQALAAGLVDELQTHVTPVVLGYGVRLLEASGPDPISLRSNTVVRGEGAVHAIYDVVH